MRRDDDTTQPSAALPRTVESRSRGDHMPCRVIHVQSLAPVLPRGPVTYGPSFAFSLSELDWINQVLFPASVTVLHHIPGHANQKKKVSVYLFACPSREISVLSALCHCHHGSSDEHSSTYWHCYLCPAPTACKTQALGLARAHQPRHVEVAIAAHTCSRRRRPASHAAYAHRTGHAGRMCLRSRTARPPLSPSALAHASRRAPRALKTLDH